MEVDETRRVENGDKLKPENVDFDELAVKLGGFGRYQIFVFLLGCLASFMAGLGAVSTVFTAYNNPVRSVNLSTKTFGIKNIRIWEQKTIKFF